MVFIGTCLTKMVFRLNNGKNVEKICAFGEPETELPGKPVKAGAPDN